METHTNLMYDGACEKNKYDLYSGSAAKAVIDSLLCQFPAPVSHWKSSLLMINEVIFLHVTKLGSHILHQYSEVNAMHLTASKNDLFYVVHQFFKAFFLLLS